MVKTDSLHKFILKDKQNLHIAAAVGEAWPEVREQMTTGFLDQLERRLKAKVRGWEFERWGRYFTDIYPCFMFWKPAWRGDYYMNLQFGDYGRTMSFGLS